MKLYYCPNCGKEEIKNDDLLRNEITLANIRDGYGRPITHYRCNCGNYLAGSINIYGMEDDKGAIDYYKHIIKEYNKGGCFYEDGLYKRAEENYVRKNKR